jgi:hypothetical protein
MSSEVLQTVIIKPSLLDEEILYQRLDQNAMLPDEQQQTADGVINAWLEESKKPIYEIVDAFKQAGAKVVDRQLSQVSLIACLPVAALEEVARLPDVQMKPLPRAQVSTPK